MCPRAGGFRIAGRAVADAPGSNPYLDWLCEEQDVEDTTGSGRRIAHGPGGASPGYWKAFLDEPEYRLAAGYLALVEERLRTAIEGLGTVGKVAAYVIEAGGRRTRPLVTLATCEGLGGDRQEAAAPAVAVEMLHTASLIHDDIVDGSRRRRGVPAAHVEFGTGAALLAGDLLCFAALQVAEPLQGAVAGGFILGLIESYVKGYFIGDWADAISMGVILIVILVRPSGLFGAKK